MALEVAFNKTVANTIILGIIVQVDESQYKHKVYTFSTIKKPHASDLCPAHVAPGIIRHNTHLQVHKRMECI